MSAASVSGEASASSAPILPKMEGDDADEAEGLPRGRSPQRGCPGEELRKPHRSRQLPRAARARQRKASPSSASAPP
eukprot:5248559-Alexandrium_andersonii.AAC.1